MKTISKRTLQRQNQRKLKLEILALHIDCIESTILRHEETPYTRLIILHLAKIRELTIGDKL